jgi:hypothetical protein
MERHATPQTGRLRRKLREFWPDRNPLRRRWDRTEATIIAGLVAAFVVGGTLAALIAGRWAYQDTMRARQAELAALHRVPAVLLTTAYAQPFGFDAVAKAWWRAPGGPRHTGQVSAPAGSPPGTKITVWVDAAGRLAAPPLQSAQVQGQGALASVLALAGVAIVLWGTGLTVHFVTDRRRMAAWDEEWRAMGPKWSRRG